MTELKTKNGIKIGILSDNLDQEEMLFIDGKQVPLSEVYANRKLKDAFNKQLKGIKDSMNGTQSITDK